MSRSVLTHSPRHVWSRLTCDVRQKKFKMEQIYGSLHAIPLIALAHVRIPKIWALPILLVVVNVALWIGREHFVILDLTWIAGSVIYFSYRTHQVRKNKFIESTAESILNAPPSYTQEQISKALIRAQGDEKKLSYTLAIIEAENTVYQDTKPWSAIVSGLKLLFSYRGAIGRSRMLFAIAGVGVIISGLPYSFKLEDQNPQSIDLSVYAVGGMALLFITFISFFAVLTKRYRDAQLSLSIPFSLLLFYIVPRFSDLPISYGFINVILPNHRISYIIFSLLISCLPLWLFLQTILAPSSPRQKGIRNDEKIAILHSILLPIFNLSSIFMLYHTLRIKNKSRKVVLLFSAAALGLALPLLNHMTL